MNEALVEMVRGLIGFFSLLIFARLLGKQQVSQLTFFDYVLGITVGSTASSLTTDLTSRAWPHWVGLVTWIVCVLILQYITLKSRYAAKYISGEPTILVMNGNIMEGAMRTMRYRATDLLEQLREKGVFDLSQVAYAVLETDGQLSVLKKAQHQPVTPQDLNMTPQYGGMCVEIIYDGKVMTQNLRDLGKDHGWLRAELAARGYRGPEEIFMLLVDPQGQLFIDPYKDRVKITDPGDFPGPS
ncbi:DUF421 domain-containing protein [Anaeroselena agilis]|uniref:DUF421 domain-containing protein n=1 Tax=Anaeroselena agilis TaxID=3063788 RepID=A0ABU3NV60_9FIRM|nr:DUF421 domain-containing protein [Selenomonadales bacterium 4137-cl]